jgi:hypothetical protein
MKTRKWKKLYGASITFTCPYCLRQYPLNEATIEHEPPKSRQKECGESKKTLACAKCNHEKGALTAQEYELWKMLNELRIHGRQI